MAASKLSGKIAILSYVTQRHQCVTCMQRLKKKRTDIVFGRKLKHRSGSISFSRNQARGVVSFACYQAKVEARQACQLSSKIKFENLQTSIQACQTSHRDAHLIVMHFIGRASHRHVSLRLSDFSIWVLGKTQMTFRERSYA